ncbi:MAG: PhoH family protein [Myxococcota bacterium]
MNALTPQSDADNRIRRVVFSDNQVAQLLFGEQTQNLKLIEDVLEVKIHLRGTTLQILGEPSLAAVAGDLLEQLYELARSGFPLALADVNHAARLLKQDPQARIRDYFLDTVVVSARKKSIVPRSPTQKAYVDAIRKHDIVFGVGPAGTGKTYLAMAMAVGALTRREVSRIVLTRPAVEAGEKLGFLPGDLAEKVNPYLRPLYDALNDMVDFEKAGKLIEKGIVEVAPLAFMRGRTLNDAFVILDEAQNTTSEQMKMFLTRLGIGSKAVITGDITQIDLPTGKASGLIEAREILSDIPRLKFVEFTKFDVVRHPLVQEVINAYEIWEQAKESRDSRRMDNNRRSEGRGGLRGAGRLLTRRGERVNDDAAAASPNTPNGSHDSGSGADS